MDKWWYSVLTCVYKVIVVHPNDLAPRAKSAEVATAAGDVSGSVASSSPQSKSTLRFDLRSGSREHYCAAKEALEHATHLALPLPIPHHRNLTHNSGESNPRSFITILLRPPDSPLLSHSRAVSYLLSPTTMSTKMMAMRPGSSAIRSLSKRRPSCSQPFSSTAPTAALSPYRRTQKSSPEKSRRPATTAAAPAPCVRCWNARKFYAS